MHKSELDVLQKLQEGETPEEQRRLELAAMYLVEANKGANVNDQLKPFLDEMVAEGAQYKQEQQELVRLLVCYSVVWRRCHMAIRWIAGSKLLVNTIIGKVLR